MLQRSALPTVEFEGETPVLRVHVAHFSTKHVQNMYRSCRQKKGRV